MSRMETDRCLGCWLLRWRRFSCGSLSGWLYTGWDLVLNVPGIMRQRWSWLVAPGRIWQGLALVLILSLSTGCVGATVSSGSVKFPRPETPKEWTLEFMPAEGVCQTSQGDRPCLLILLEDFMGLLEERKALRKGLVEADHTLCLINGECK